MDEISAVKSAASLCSVVTASMLEAVGESEFPARYLPAFCVVTASMLKAVGEQYRSRRSWPHRCVVAAPMLEVVGELAERGLTLSKEKSRNRLDA